MAFPLAIQQFETEEGKKKKEKKGFQGDTRYRWTDLQLPVGQRSRSQEAAASRKQDKFLNYSGQLLSLSQRF